MPTDTRTRAVVVAVAVAAAAVLIAALAGWAPGNERGGSFDSGARTGAAVRPYFWAAVLVAVVAVAAWRLSRRR